jgi:8-oxo-dGTP diphosphatase
MEDISTPKATAMLVVAGALRDGEGRYLLAKRPPDKHHGGLWEFPGGKVEPGESCEDALIRELAEELGVALDPDHLLPNAFATGAAEDGSAPIVLLLYTCTRWAGQPRAIEASELRWCEPGQFTQMEMPPLDIVLAERLTDGSQ